MSTDRGVAVTNGETVRKFLDRTEPVAQIPEGLTGLDAVRWVIDHGVPASLPEELPAPARLSLTAKRKAS
jgi:hypothetical protein